MQEKLARIEAERLAEEERTYVDTIPLPPNIKELLDIIPDSVVVGSWPRECLRLQHKFKGSYRIDILAETEKLLKGGDIDIYTATPISENITELGFSRTNKPDLYVRKNPTDKEKIEVFHSPKMGGDLTITTFYTTKEGKTYSKNPHALKHLLDGELHTIDDPAKTFTFNPKSIFRYLFLVASGYKPIYKPEFMKEMYVNLSKLNNDEIKSKLCKHFTRGNARANLLEFERFGLFDYLFPGIHAKGFNFLLDQMQSTDDRVRNDRGISQLHIFSYFIIARYQTDIEQAFFKLNNEYLKKIMDLFRFPETLQQQISMENIIPLMRQIDKVKKKTAAHQGHDPRFFGGQAPQAQTALPPAQNPSIPIPLPNMHQH